MRYYQWNKETDVVTEVSSIVSMTDIESRRVSHDYVDGNGFSATVSTVFLGTDHNFFDKGPPLLFETMVFYGTSFSDAYCDRCSTSAEARSNHAAVLAALRGEPSTMPDEDAKRLLADLKRSRDG